MSRPIPAIVGSRLRAVGLSVAVCLALAWAGCSPPCETADSKPVRYSDGTVYPSGNIYESSAWDGAYLHFPAGRRYQLEHKLGRRPADVTTYLAFEEIPLPGSNVAESAGNQAVIEVVDDEIVQVRNDTCSEFYLRVVAIADGPGSSDAGAGDASVD